MTNHVFTEYKISVIGVLTDDVLPCNSVNTIRKVYQSTVSILKGKNTQEYRLKIPSFLIDVDKLKKGDAVKIDGI